MKTEDKDAGPLPSQMLPAGWIAEVVTYLEMRAPPALRADTAAGLSLRRMSADVAAFRKAGGRIEVLGVTRSLLRIGREGDETLPPVPANPSPTRSRR